ncbi:TPA: hypothetical protein TY768_001269 [Streptococcus suis]|nr:hypothetical protein [Streptococcus suis]
MVSKKFQEYLDMTTRAKEFGGANNYQVALVVGGIAVGYLATVAWNYFSKGIKPKKERTAKQANQEQLYKVVRLPKEAADELGKSCPSLTIGTRFHLIDQLEIAGKETAFIDIVGGKSNPYLVPFDILHSISDIA